VTAVASFAQSTLLSRLPGVRGKLSANESLAGQSWFRVGGPAEVLFKPVDTEDIATFMAGCPADVPVTVIGVASNLIIRDGGVPGVVIRLGPDFARTTTEGTAVTAGAAALDMNVAKVAQTAGITGMAFLSGIPGSVGGGLRMNAGAYGGEFKDIVTTATAVTRRGQIVSLKNADFGFTYRHTAIDPTMIFTSAVLHGTSGDPAVILQEMQRIQSARGDTQPIREKTGGSTFANPDHDPQGRKSWQLVDAAGCRGLRVGGAQVSEKHCNFLINTGTATAADIENLGETVRRRVLETSGVELRWEIKRIGIPLEDQQS